MKQEVEGLVHGRHSTRAHERNDSEPVDEGQQDPDLDPAGSLVGGAPPGMSEEDVTERGELARWLYATRYPKTGC
ncbi:MAG: hypothetical protein ACRDYU_05405 [Actinomycetes bacterium]